MVNGWSSLKVSIASMGGIGRPLPSCFSRGEAFSLSGFPVFTEVVLSSSIVRF